MVIPIRMLRKFRSVQLTTNKSCSK